MARLSGTNTGVDSPPDSPAASSSDGPNATELYPPFFNTTFSTHRISPLHIGNQILDPARLEVIARRLRDILVGDVIRGIQVGLESTETAAGQVGTLKAVQVRWFRPSSVLGNQAPRHIEADLLEERNKGLWIDIRHENAAYAAILLPTQALDETDATSGFLHLPLLLMRMPMALKAVIAGWLCDTFDCRVNRMSLGTKTIVGVWESWIGAVGLHDRGPEIVITLAFNLPLQDKAYPIGEESEDEALKRKESGIRSIDITISPQDLRNFVRAGVISEPLDQTAAWTNDARERRRLAGGNVDDGWAWRTQNDAELQPFTEALARYLDHHLALNLFHPSVHVTQISCAGFVLGQSRLKVLKIGELSEDLSRAAWTFVTQLGDRIKDDRPSTASIFTATKFAD